MAQAQRTIPRLWQDAVARWGERPAYLVEGEDGWRRVSWREAGRRVEELANGLLALGIRKGDAFGILGATTLEWALFDFALAHVGAITAPVYANSGDDDVAHVLGHSDAVGVLVQDEEQRARVTRLDL